MIFLDKMICDMTIWILWIGYSWLWRAKFLLVEAFLQYCPPDLNDACCLGRGPARQAPCQDASPLSSEIQALVDHGAPLLAFTGAPVEQHSFRISHPPVYSARKAHTVRARNFCPGIKVARGKCGWFGASGKWPISIATPARKGYVEPPFMMRDVLIKFAV